jgi:hypothetical protein
MEELDLRKDNKFNPAATIAVIASPQSDFSEAELERLNTWLNNDNKLERHLLVFTHATADCPNLYEYLDVEWGLEVTDEMLYETDGSRVLGALSSYYGGYASFADGLENSLTTETVGTANLLFLQTRRIKNKLSLSDDNGASNPYNIPLVSFPSSVELVSIEDSKNRYKADSYPVYGMVASYKYGYSNELQSGIASTVTVCGCPAAAYEDFLTYSSVKNEELFLSYAQRAARVDAQMHLSIKVLSSDTISCTADEAFNLGIWVFTVAVPALTLIACLVVFIRRRHL